MLLEHYLAFECETDKHVILRAITLPYTIQNDYDSRTQIVTRCRFRPLITKMSCHTKSLSFHKAGHNYVRFETDVYEFLMTYSAFRQYAAPLSYVSVWGQTFLSQTGSKWPQLRSKFATGLSGIRFFYLVNH